MSRILGVNTGRGARFEAVTVVLLRIQVFWDVMSLGKWSVTFSRYSDPLNMGTILSMTLHPIPENLNLYQHMLNRIAPLCSQIAKAG